MDARPPQLQAHTDRTLESRVAREVHSGFVDRYPRSVEHCLRLVTERLQLSLDKRNLVDLMDVSSWILSPQDILALAQSLELLDQINRRNHP
jgi:hypothetical protein